MCGLWGAFSDGELSALDYQRALTLATLSELRGMDSSGYVLLAEKDRKLVAHHDKDIVTASQLLYANPKVSSAFKSSDVFAFFGHSRAATVGDITKENAHPFRHKHILGMHNGTVNHLGDSTKTDSQAIFEMLAEDGLEKTLKEIDTGAYVLVWVDYHDASLNIIKNVQRPLVIVKATNGTYYWTSEWEMMEFMKKRHSLVSYASSYYPASNELYRFDLFTRELTRREIKPYKPVVYYKSVPSIPNSESFEKKAETYFEKKVKEQAKLLAPPPAPTISKADEEKVMAGLSRKQKRRLRQEWALQRKAAKLAAEKKEKEPVTTLQEPPVYRGFRGRPMTAKTAEELLAKGCKLYDQVCKITDKVFWITPDSYVCEDAVKDGALQSYGIKEATACFYKADGL